MHTKLSRIFNWLIIWSLLLVNARITVPTVSLAATSAPDPLPSDCIGVTPIGEPISACCLYIYVYSGAVPVLGATVRVQNSRGIVDGITAIGSKSSQPYLNTALSSVPLQAVPGEVITITASYNGMVSVVAWTVQNGAQQVDVGLVPGYQAVSTPLQADAAFKSASLMFIEKTLQPDAPRFQVWSGNQTVSLTDDAIWLTVFEATSPTDVSDLSTDASALAASSQPRQGVNLRFSFENANPHPRLEPFNRLDTHVSYFRGNDPSRWRADEPVWGGVRYKELYPGVDLEITGENGQWQWRMVGREADDLGMTGAPEVRLHVEGANALAIAGDFLQMKTAIGDLALPLLIPVSTNTRPVQTTLKAVVENNIVRQPFAHVSSSMLQASKVASQSGDGDLIYSTFIGGGAWDETWRSAVDLAGNIYLVGTTASVDFPVTPGAFGTNDSGSSVFVAKLNASGSSLLYVAFLEGNSNDYGKAITVDENDYVYVTGETWSPDFPITPGAFQTTLNYYAGYVTKLNPNGTALIYSTFLGVGGSKGQAVAVDSTGAAYITGNTQTSAFPVTGGAFDTTFNGIYDTFLAKLNAAGNGLVYATFLGGSNSDYGMDIAIDSSHNAYITGASLSSDFPITAGAFDVNFGGGVCGVAPNTYPCPDAFIVKVDAAGSTLSYAAFLGGANSDRGLGVAVDNIGNVLVAGVTTSVDFPATVGAVDTNLNGVSDAFVAKVAPNGSALIYATFLGGSNGEGDTIDDFNNRSIDTTIDGDGNAYVVGVTASSDFPVTPGAFDTSYNSNLDAFVTKLNAAGTTVLYSSFLGGVSLDCIYQCSVSLDSVGDVFISGRTDSGNFPTTMGAFDTTFNGASDIFVTKLTLNTWTPPSAAFSAAPLTGSIPLTVTFTDQSAGDITSWTWNLGDGGVSGARHPSHIYTNSGLYSVSLTVSGPGGTDTETKADYITVSPDGSSAPVASISYIWYTSYPNAAVQGVDTIYFNGSAADVDEGGAYITNYEWISDRDGLLSAQEDFILPAAQLSPGDHIISFRAQDDEGEWSPTATRTLTVQVGQGDVRTLILVNGQKLVDLYNVGEADALLSKLNALAAHAAVDGLVLQLENDAPTAAAYAARGTDYTSKSKANAVAEAIRQVILAQWSAHPTLEYVVLVGDDRALPFYRIQDGTYLPDTWTLTDDFYVDQTPTPCNQCANPTLYIPDLAAGRLVETPVQMRGQVDAFLASSTLNLDSAIVTGYDFVENGAQAHCNTLQADGLNPDCSLLGESWNAVQFISKVLNTFHAAASISAHATEYGFGTPSGFVSASDFANAPIDFSRTIFYTVGCHSGLNIPTDLDLAESLAIKKAVYLANTGYGWGGGGVILSEELTWDFTKKLVFGTQSTPGKALVLAKQQYYVDHPNPDAYDEKITTEHTLYGLPMYQVTTPANTPAERSILAVSPDFRVSSTEVRLASGLTIESKSISWPMPTAEDTGSGVFYPLYGMVTAGDGKPLLPRFTYEIGKPDLKLMGAVFTGGAFETVSVSPPIQHVITTSVEAHFPVQNFNTPGWFPSIFVTAHRLELANGVKEGIWATAGQYNPNLASNQQRIFTGMNFDVYYHPNPSDWTPPALAVMRSQVGDNTSIQVGATDASGIQAVVIAYTDGVAAWNSVSLAQNGNLWVGNFPADVEFFVQIVDKSGNVTMIDKAGQYFRPGDSVFSTLYLPLVKR